MRHGSVVPKLYGALFDISLLREQMLGLVAQVPHADAARLLARATELEATALQLVDRIETRHQVPAH